MRSVAIVAMLIAQTIAMSLSPEFLMGCGQGVYAGFNKQTLEQSGCDALDMHTEDLEEFNNTYQGALAMAKMMNNPQINAILNIVAPVVTAGEAMYSVVFHYGDASEHCQGMALGINFYALFGEIIMNFIGIQI